MHHVITIDAGDTFELHLRVPEAERPAGIGLIQDMPPALAQSATEPDDTRGLMMKAPVWDRPYAEGVGGSGAPIGLAGEFVANPTGTFLKYYFKSY